MGKPARQRSARADRVRLAAYGCPICGMCAGPRQEWVTVRPCPACLIDLRRLDQRPVEAVRIRSAIEARAHAGRTLASELEHPWLMDEPTSVPDGRAGCDGHRPTTSPQRYSRRSAAHTSAGQSKTCRRESDGLTGRAQLALVLDQHRPARDLIERPAKRVGELSRLE